MQDRAFDVGHLIDDRAEQLPAHVGGRLELLVGARAGRAQQVAAVRDLQIETDRLAHRGAAHRAHAFEVTARVDGDFGRG